MSFGKSRSKALSDNFDHTKPVPVYFVGTGLLICCFWRNCFVFHHTNCIKPILWTIYRVNDKIHFYFVNDKFFKIYLFNSCDRELSNGTAIGINMNPAMELDPELTYDDWEKDYQSPERILS